MALPFVTKNFNPTDTTFELKCDKLSVTFIGNQNTCIRTEAVPLATGKSNLTSTMFDSKFLCFRISNI